MAHSIVQLVIFHLPTGSNIPLKSPPIITPELGRLLSREKNLWKKEGFMLLWVNLFLLLGCFWSFLNGPGFGQTETVPSGILRCGDALTGQG